MLTAVPLQATCIIEIPAKPCVVTVIMPLYNSEKTVRKTIESVISQTYSDWELVIIDDASTDGSVEVVREFVNSKVRLFCSSQNRGAYVSTNECILRARGSFITKIDSDDVFDPRKLELQVAEFSRRPQYEAVGHGMHREGLGDYGTTAEVSYMIRRSVFDKIGFFDSVRFSADSEFSERLTLRCCVGHLKEVLYFATAREGSLTTHPSSRLGTKCRRSYVEEYRKWHLSASTNSLFIEYPMITRPFVAGVEMLP